MPASPKQLRGFLSIAGCYRRFIKGYGELARPLTELLKKESFYWNEVAQLSFEQLKSCLSATSFLALPDMNKVFLIEADASSYGIGVVLMQEGHPY